MIDKKLKEKLLLYQVENPHSEQIEKAKQLVFKNERPVKVPYISAKRVVLSQIQTVSNWFWLFSLLFIFVIVYLSFKINNQLTTLFLCGATPLLSIVSMPVVLSNIDASRMELESTCLIKPQTVFSAKMLICGCFDLIVIIITLLFSSRLSEIDIVRSAVLGLISFTASSFLSLGASLIFKTQVAISLVSAVYATIVACFVSMNFLSEKLLEIKMPFLVLALVISLALVYAMYSIAMKNYSFEKVAKRFGNKIF